jgi:hypothetical protein
MLVPQVADRRSLTYGYENPAFQAFRAACCELYNRAFTLSPERRDFHNRIQATAQFAESGLPLPERQDKRLKAVQSIA